MHPNQLLIQDFYEAFARKDYQKMAECYHPEATFSDPAFQLRGPEIAAMWKMLITRGKDLELTFSKVEADAQRGSANWEARYTFSQTGHKVHNIIHAEFQFRGGRIWSHTDTFSFHRWARQALGLKGWLLGGTTFLRKKVQQSAMEGLQKFMSK